MKEKARALALANKAGPLLQDSDELLRARRLRKLHTGIPLEVNGPNRPFTALARCLAQHDAELAVTQLEVLDAESARALCQHRLLRLHFHGTPRSPGRQPSASPCRGLTDELAAVLAEHAGVLWIDGLASLSSARSDVLARHNGPVFVADRTKIEPAADARLQECAFQSPILREDLDLAGADLRVRRMTAALAEALVFFQGGWLLLDALEDLSVDHARLLGARNGRLSLNGLEEISPQVVDKLVAHSIAVPGTYIPSLIDNSSPWMPWTRHVRLNGLRRLESAVARQFVHYRGILEFNGLRSLDVEAAESLLKVDGEVHLKGLQNLDEKMARVLSPRRHILRLPPRLEKMLEKTNVVSRGR